MAETRKLAAILAADVVGYSRLAGADEEGTVARIRALRSELIDPAIASNRGRIAVSLILLNVHRRACGLGAGVPDRGASMSVLGSSVVMS